MVNATGRCRMCDEPLTPGATFCPHCGARVDHDLDDDAVTTGRGVKDDERSHGMWLVVAAIVAIVAVVAIAFASTSGGGGGNAPSTSVSPATPATSPASRPPSTRPPVTTPRST